MRPNYLISIHPKHSNRIFCGQKTAELRNRPVYIPKGAKLWIYETRPTMGIVGYANVASIARGSPAHIWKTQGQCFSLSKSEFTEYVKDREVVSAILLSDVKPLEKPLTLEWLKQQNPLFHPPQFYYELGSKPELHNLLEFGA